MKFITLAVLASLSLSAFSATSDDLKLKGKVPKKLSIKVTQLQIATDLDLEASPNDMVIASVEENSNSNVGYKISAQSLNGGVLKNPAAGSVPVSYSLSYDGIGFTLPATGSVEVKNEGTSGVYNTSSDIGITYVGADHETRVEGSYTDTVTFTIATN
ncbi:MAG: fimbrial protein [Bdellovibrionota bacterium]